MPENGRAMNAYFKFDYQITAYNSDYFGTQYPNKFRLIMEKRLDPPLSNLLAPKCEIVCTHHEALKKVIDKGYIGVGIICSRTLAYLTCSTGCSLFVHEHTAH